MPALTALTLDKKKRVKMNLRWGASDKYIFRLDADQWEAFMTVLNAPPRRLPRLQRLFKDPGFFHPRLTGE